MSELRPRPVHDTGRAVLVNVAACDIGVSVRGGFYSHVERDLEKST
jgi:hypothetical protein